MDIIMTIQAMREGLTGADGIEAHCVSCALVRRCGQDKLCFHQCRAEDGVGDGARIVSILPCFHFFLFYYPQPHEEDDTRRNATLQSSRASQRIRPRQPRVFALGVIAIIWHILHSFHSRGCSVIESREARNGTFRLRH